MCPLNRLRGGKREGAAVNMASGLDDDNSLDYLVEEDEESGNDERVQV